MLLDARLADGYWRGALSGSALATATALFALAVVNQEKYSRLIEKGLLWLAENVNSDGGWGDTIVSDSNISTTVLCWAAFTPTKDDPQYQKVVERATDWLTEQAGNTRSKNIAQALTRRYGHDRTFSAPILTMSALSGRWGSSNQAWQYVKPLPFEWGVISHRWLKWLRLPVVSYALPALIAIGQVRYHFLKPRNPLALLIRHLARNKTLSVLQKIQPDSGGFLEAIPITSFVVMSLAEMGLKDHTVVKKGVEFITASMREDGSWPIDTNLATWVTTLSVKALAGGSGLNKHLDSKERQKIVDWLLMQQHRTEHPYTQAAPGGWAWTDLSGGVPDADDTAGALLALRKLAEPHERILPAVKAGVQWLLKLQNRDGGIPTFCRGWGKLPFDRSGADLTAHAVAAWDEWFDILPKQLQKRTQKAIYKAIHYLLRVQRPEGSWIPLWFANQAAPGRENPTYGTARVVSAVVEPLIRSVPQAWLSLEKALQWLIKIKNDDGGWGGAQNVVSSIEETAVAVQALQKYYSVCNHIEGQPTGVPSTKVKEAIDAGINWLMVHTKEGTEFNPVPIGLYFAELWYYEKLYPIIFTVAALEQNARLKSW
ncbi:MAG: hypothetical protein AMJ79_03525 [Phycisphaerae bacterium SM23_30]|nr:MAG: hypothetical protein AMJ79_03525 [Phycisphaerae bacterium SM23_30]